MYLVKMKCGFSKASLSFVVFAIVSYATGRYFFISIKISSSSRYGLLRKMALNYLSRLFCSTREIHSGCFLFLSLLKVRVEQKMITIIWAVAPDLTLNATRNDPIAFGNEQLEHPFLLFSTLSNFESFFRFIFRNYME